MKRQQENGLKLKEDGFRLGVKKKFFTVSVLRHRNKCPEKLCILHPCRYSGPDWMELWMSWSSERCPLPIAGDSELGDLYGPFWPNQSMILWFYNITCIFNITCMYNKCFFLILSSCSLFVCLSHINPFIVEKCCCLPVKFCYLKRCKYRWSTLRIIIQSLFAWKSIFYFSAVYTGENSSRRRKKEHKHKF